MTQNSGKKYFYKFGKIVQDIQVEAYRLKCNALDSLSVCPLKLPLSACLSMIKKLLKAFRSKFKKNQNWMFWETKMLVLPCSDKKTENGNFSM